MSPSGGSQWVAMGTLPLASGLNLEQVRQGHRDLAQMHPHARCELDFTSPLELLIATVLSAQTTDVRVNQVTPQLFTTFPDAAAYASADQAEVESIIRPTGMFRSKARALIGIGQKLLADFQGQVPARLEDLVSLPGVGRKTANVVLANAFGVPGIAVDTHVARVTNRLGWTSAREPVKIERELQEFFAPEDWTLLCHQLIFHGRYCCTARSPQCGRCLLKPICPSATGL